MTNQNIFHKDREAVDQPHQDEQTLHLQTIQLHWKLISISEARCLFENKIISEDTKTSQQIP